MTTARLDWRRLCGRLISGLAAMIAMVAVIAPGDPAAAANLDGSCNSGEYCMYDLADLESWVHDRTDGSVNNFAGLSWWGTMQFMNDDASSIWNRQGSTKCLYENLNQDGSSRCVSSGSAAGSLGVMDQAGTSYGS